MCDADEEARCLDEFGENGIAWACEKCPKSRRDDLHPYTLKLLHLAALQRGGYPIDANELTIEEWVDLGMVKEALRPQTPCPMIRRDG